MAIFPCDLSFSSLSHYTSSDSAFFLLLPGFGLFIFLLSFLFTLCLSIIYLLFRFHSKYLVLSERFELILYSILS